MIKRITKNGFLKNIFKGNLGKSNIRLLAPGHGVCRLFSNGRRGEDTFADFEKELLEEDRFKTPNKQGDFVLSFGAQDTPLDDEKAQLEAKSGYKREMGKSLKRANISSFYRTPDLAEPQEIELSREEKLELLKEGTKGGLREVLENKEKVKSAKIVQGLKLVKTLDKNGRSKNFRKMKKIDKNVLYSIAHHPYTQNLPPKKLIIFYSIIHKMRVLKFWNAKEIKKNFQKISTYLKKLDFDEITTFANLISKIKMRDERLFDKIYEHYMLNLEKVPPRNLIVTLSSFVDISLYKDNLQSYSKLFKQSQVVLALHLRNGQNWGINEKDIAGIVTSYSKTQNFNKEFLMICERATLDNFNKCSMRTIATIYHSFNLNGHDSEEIYLRAVKKFSENIPAKTGYDYSLSEWIMLVNNIVIKKIEGNRFSKKMEKSVIVLDNPMASDVEPLMPEEYQIIDYTLNRFAVESLSANFLDSKIIHKTLIRYIEHFEAMLNPYNDHKKRQEILPEILEKLLPAFEANFDLFLEYRQLVGPQDCIEYFLGIEYVLLLKTEKSFEFVRELKYRIKTNIGYGNKKANRGTGNLVFSLDEELKKLGPTQDEVDEIKEEMRRRGMDKEERRAVFLKEFEKFEEYKKVRSMFERILQK